MENCIVLSILAHAIKPRVLLKNVERDFDKITAFCDIYFIALPLYFIKVEYKTMNEL